MIAWAEPAMVNMCELAYNLDSPSYPFPVPSHFLHLLQFSADYHVIWISGSVIHLSAETVINTAKILPYETSKTKVFQLLGGFAPQTPIYSLTLPCSPYLGAPLKFVLAPLGLQFWRQRCISTYFNLLMWPNHHHHHQWISGGRRNGFCFPPTYLS